MEYSRLLFRTLVSAAFVGRARADSISPTDCYFFAAVSANANRDVPGVPVEEMQTSALPSTLSTSQIVGDTNPDGGAITSFVDVATDLTSADAGRVVFSRIGHSQVPPLTLRSWAESVLFAYNLSMTQAGTLEVAYDITVLDETGDQGSLLSPYRIGVLGVQDYLVGTDGIAARDESGIVSFNLSTGTAYTFLIGTGNNVAVDGRLFRSGTAQTSGTFDVRFTPTAVPEPSSVIALAVGAASLGLSCRRVERRTRRRIPEPSRLD
jgi:hypothetical protein